MAKHNGFTLIELMVTLSIAAILAVVAAPSLSSFLDNGRSFRGANTISSAMRYARAEALNMQSPVIVCGWDASKDDCSGSDNWQSGVGVFVDNNRNGSRDADERILKTTEPFDSRDQIQASRASLQFSPEGRVQGLASMSVRYCPLRADNNYNRLVTINGSGRVQSTRGELLAGDCD